jgi:hypothetical protein
VCHKETELEDPKDLRAVIGKAPNSTNERKQMSKKTIKQRIALVAALALGTGVLSVAPANAGDIAANQIVVAAIGSGNTALSICAVTTASSVDSAVVPLGSQGVQLETTAGAASDDAYISVSGAGRISAVGSNWTVGTGGSSADTTGAAGGVDGAAVLTGSANSADDVTIVPTGLGTIKISYGVTSTSSTLDVITLTVVATCSNKTFSAANSKVGIVRSATGYTFGSSSWTATNVDDSGYNLVTNGGTGYLRMALKDVYGAALAADALIASVTAGECVVGISDYDASGSASPSAGSGKTAVDSDTGADDLVAVAQSTAGADLPQNCSVSISYAGTVVATKNFTFEGAPAKITVTDVTAGIVGTANSGLYRVSVTDAAGNPLSGQVITSSSSEANNAAALASGVITDVQDTSGAATISSTTATDGKTFAVAYADRAEGNMTGYTCGKEGTAKLTVRTNVDAASSTYITSEPFTVACGGALDTWTVSMDKASYSPGEIATLTLSGKTAKGNPVGTFVFLSGVEYSFGGMTAVTAPTNNDAFSTGLGTKQYKFSVGTTEGAFVGSFKTTGSTDDSAKTVQYKVASSTATVSNADVLKSIVALIASINKQIQALQKLILKR